MYTIYKITNKENGKFYIGSTKTFNRRKNKHLNLLFLGKHHSQYLQNAYNKYGKNAFEFSIIDNIEDPEDVFSTENKYIEVLKPEYNMMKNVFSHIGMKRTKETCEKISKALTGKHISEETKEKLRQANLGKVYSIESRNKKSEALKIAWSKRNIYPIAAYYKNGLLFRQFDSVTDAVEKLKCSRNCIIGVINKRKSKKSYLGYIWKKI